MGKIGKKTSWFTLFILQGIVLIYSLSTVMAKFAAETSFLSIEFFLFYGAEIFVLGIYAVLWQQVIKKVDLSVAYANRAMNLLWSIVWAIVIFKESVSIKNIIGVGIVSLGIFIVNSDGVE